MKNIVTFETAKALQSAGFPQPDPEAGQYWYAPDGGLYWTQCGDGTYYTVRQVGAPNAQGWTTRFDGWVFAPTATDILAELAKAIHPNILRIDVSAFDSDNKNEVHEPKYLIYAFPYGDIAGRQFCDSLVQAAALAYLELKKA